MIHVRDRILEALGGFVRTSIGRTSIANPMCIGMIQGLVWQQGVSLTPKQLVVVALSFEKNEGSSRDKKGDGQKNEEGEM